MSNKSGCLIIVMAVMIFLTYIAIKQGYNTIYNDSWENNYIQQKVEVTSIFKDSSYIMSNDTGSYTYSFKPVVTYNFNNKILVDTLIIHRSIEKSKFYPGDSIAVSISKIDGKITGDPDKDRIATGIVNLLQGVFFFVIGLFAYRYFKKILNSKIRKL